MTSGSIQDTLVNEQGETVLREAVMGETCEQYPGRTVEKPLPTA